jgi:hypothetical protein
VLAIFITLVVMSTLQYFRHQIELSLENYLVASDEPSPVDVIHFMARSD